MWLVMIGEGDQALGLPHLSPLCYERRRSYEMDGIAQAGLNGDPRQQLACILRDFHVLLLGPEL